jgi:hypothetical protein
VHTEDNGNQRWADCRVPSEVRGIQVPARDRAPAAAFTPSRAGGEREPDPKVGGYFMCTNRGAVA